MDMERILLLLNIVHKTLDMPEFRYIADEALKELRTFAPKVEPSQPAINIFPSNSGVVETPSPVRKI